MVWFDLTQTSIKLILDDVLNFVKKNMESLSFLRFLFALKIV